MSPGTIIVTDLGRHNSAAESALGKGSGPPAALPRPDRLAPSGGRTSNMPQVEVVRPPSPFQAVPRSGAF
jgi:hypothetical protein